MKTIMNRIRAASIGLIVGAGLLVASPALALDRVTLKDGTVYEGEIVREEACCVWIKIDKGGKKQEKMFFKSDTSAVERNVDAATPADKPADAPADKPAQPATTDAPKPADSSDEKSDENADAPKPVYTGAPRAAVVTMGDHKGEKDMVGIFMTAYALEKARPLLEEEIGTDKSGVVVLRVSSGGGALFEIQKISDEIHFNYKKRFRVVAWIESAISAAAMSSLCIEEIYFTPVGNFGACTGYSGALVAVKGFELEQVLSMMREISARGGYHPDIMRAMQIQHPLSCTIDENGKVNWYPDTVSGKIIVNRDNEILTFNATNALEVGFSRGTAVNIQELQEKMGYKELQWIGESIEGLAWPVCKAEKWTMKFRDQTKKDQDEANIVMRDYQRNRGAAEAAQPEDRPPFVNKARKALDRLKKIAKSNPGIAIFVIGAEPDQLLEWLEQQERDLKQLLRDK